MAQHQLAVGGGADIHLDIVGPQADRLFKRRHRVLGMMQVLAAMRDGDHAAGLRLGRRAEAEWRKGGIAS